MTRIGGGGLQRVGGGTQQGCVAFGRIGQHGGAHFLRHGERDQEVVAGQQATGLTLQPRLHSLVLAARTMPIATRTRHRLRTATTGATVTYGPQRLGATSHDGSQDLLLMGRHRVTVTLQVLPAVAL